MVKIYDESETPNEGGLFKIYGDCNMMNRNRQMRGRV